MASSILHCVQVACLIIKNLLYLLVHYTASENILQHLLVCAIICYISITLVVVIIEEFVDYIVTDSVCTYAYCRCTYNAYTTNNCECCAKVRF